MTHATIAELAAGLRRLGIGPGDRVALLAETRPEWTVCDLAVASTGAVCVPIYPTSSSDECAWVLRDSAASVVICEHAGHVDRIASVRAELPALRLVFAIEPQPGVLSVADLRVPGGRRRVVSSGEPATIIYASGTTGPPKGCALTNANWRASLDAIEGCTTLGPGDTAPDEWARFDETVAFAADYRRRVERGEPADHARFAAVDQRLGLVRAALRLGRPATARRDGPHRFRW